MVSPRPRVRSARRRIIRLFVVIAMLAALAAGFVAFGPPGRHFLRSKILTHLHRATGGIVEIDSVAIDPFAPGISIRGLRLHDGRHILEEMRMGHGRIDISWGALSSGRIRPTRIEVFDFELSFTREENSEKKAPVIDLSLWDELRTVALQRGSVIYSERRIPIDVVARGIDLGLVEAGDGLAGPVSTADVIVRWAENASFELRETRAVLRWDGKTLTAERVVARGEAGEIDATVELAFSADDIRVEGDFDASWNLASVLGDDLQQVGGHVLLDGRFDARLSGEWNVAGSARGEHDIEIAGRRCLDAKAHFSAEAGVAIVSEGEAVCPGLGEITDFGAIWSGGTWRAHAAGRSAIDDLLEQAAAPASLLAGRLEWRIDIDQRGVDDAWEWQARGEVKGEVSEPEPTPMRIEARGSTESGRVEAEGHWSGAAWEGDLAWSGGLADARWTGRIEWTAARKQDARRLLRRLASIGKSRGAPLDSALIPKPGGKTAGRIDLAGRGKTLEQAEISFEMAAPTWSAGQDAKLAAGAATTDKLEGRIVADSSGWVSLDARLSDERGAGVVLSARNDRIAPLLSLNAHEMPLSWLLPLTGEDGRWRRWARAGGRLDADLVYGIGRDLAAMSGAARLRTFVDPGWPVDVRGVGRWKDGVLEVPALSIAAADSQVFASGRIGGLAFSQIDPLASMRLSLDADLSLLGPVLAMETGVAMKMQGKVLADASIEALGRGNPLEVEGRVRWNDLVVAGTPITDGKAVVVSSEEGTRIAAGGRDLAVEIEIGGPVDQAEAEVEIRWDDLDVLTLVETKMSEPLPLSLGLWSSGSLRFGGPVADPAKWSGTGEITKVEMAGAEVLASLKSPVSWHVSSTGRIEIVRDDAAVLLDRRGREVTLWGSFHAWGKQAGEVDLRLTGSSDLGMIEAFDPDLIASGAVKVDLAVRGAAHDPSYEGTALIDQGSIFRLGFGEIADALEGRLVFDDHRIRIQEGKFLLGGGRVDYEGSLDMSGWVPGQLALSLRARDVALRVPAGFHGRYDADLSVEGSFADPLIQGRITLLAGRVARDMTPRLIGGVRTRTVNPAFSSRSWPARIGLDLSFVADDSLSIRTDLARLEAGARLTVAGTAAQPSLQGRVNLGQGGQISFRGQDYEIIDGEVVFDEIRGEPARFRIRASTRVRDYQIQLDLEASSDQLDYQLTSAPALPRADILSLLLTGQTLAEMQSRGQTGVESDLAAAYFGSQIGELLLAGTARRMLGLSRFEISPSTVGPDADPTARVTLGRQLDDRTFVLYSRDLSGRGRDVYRLERELSHSWRIVAGREILGGVGADLRWLRRLDAVGRSKPTAVAAERRRLGKLLIEGLPSDMKVGARRLGLLGHRPLSRARIVEAHEALRRRLVERGYLEAQIRHDPIDFDSNERESDLVFHVDPGAEWKMLFKGPSPAVRAARNTVLDLWAVTWFRPTRLREAESVLREAFAEDGFAAASVEVRRDPSADRRLIFEIDPGPKVRVLKVDVAGAQNIDPKRVREQILSRPGGWFGGTRTLYRPRLVGEDAEAIRTLYESMGYLDASVETRTRFTGDGAGVTLLFQIEEGRPYRIGAIRVVGDWPEDLGHATDMITIENGDLFVPAEVRREERRLRDILDRAGYQEARVRLRVEMRDGDVVVTFMVHAGRSLRIADLRFEGLRRTKKRVLEENVTLKEGRPLSNRALLQTERNLYRLGLFRRVDITTHPLEGKPSERNVVIRLEEAKNVSVMVGAGYDSEEKGRMSISLTNENLAGRGRVGSLQTFYSSLRKNVRLTLDDRHISRGRLEGLATLGWLQEEREGFTEQTTSATLQIGSQPRGVSRWQLIYTLSDTKLTKVSLSDDALRDVLRADRALLDGTRLGSLGASFVVDHRDDPFLPQDGSFLLTEVKGWAGLLGSEVPFFRWTGQWAKYEPLGADGRVVLAGSLRAGWLRPFGGAEIPLSERFFAGGADSVRGFSRDALGPRDPLGGEALGGTTLLIANLESRFRVHPWVDMVVFSDAGNVWAENEVFKGGLRWTAGLGFRLRTPAGALRIEYGRKLAPQPGESSGEFYFSIGEAF